MLNNSIGQQPNACDIVLRLLLHEEHVKVPSVCSSGAGVRRIRNIAMLVERALCRDQQEQQHPLRGLRSHKRQDPQKQQHSLQTKLHKTELHQD